MPRQQLMTWDGKPNFRWQKMKKGVWYRVTCRELGLPENLWTQDGSRDAANAWWEEKMASVALEGKASEQAQIEQAKKLIGIQARNHALFLATFTKDLPERAAEEIKSVGDVAASVIAPAVPDATFSAWLEKWQTAKRGGMRPKSFKNITYLVARWKELPFLQLPVSAIGTETCLKFKNWVSTARKLDKNETKDELSDSQRFQHCVYFSDFVQWLWRNEALENLPRNLSDVSWPVGAKAVRIIPLKEVKACLAVMKNDFHRLMALLTLNTGADANDIGGMLKADLVDGVWTRKRGKTSRKKNSPIVSYRLWPEVMELLERFKSNHPTLMLTTSAGTPLYSAWYDEDGEPHAKNQIGTNWSRANYPMTLKEMRKVPAQLLRASKQFKGYAKLVLSHAGGDTITNHYAPEDQGGFWDALEYIRMQIL